MSAVRGADAVIAVSRALAVETERLTGVVSHVLPIGIDLRHFTPLDRSEARAALGLPVDAFIALHVGALVEAKGVNTLVDAIAAVPLENKLLIMVGEGPASKPMTMIPWIRLEGRQPNERIRYYMAAANVLILASYREGLPTVLVEAGASGTPVIASRVGGIPQLLSEDRGLLVDAGTSSDLVQAISAVLSAPEEARIRAMRLREHVLEAYDADENARLLVQLYQSVVENVGDRAQGQGL